MMKHILLSLLLSSASATSLRRLVAENADLLSALDDVDLLCMMGGAMDIESCSDLTDASGEQCVWCPIGSDYGGCVSNDIAAIVNGAEIPHLTCGAELTEGDTEFYDDLEGCLVGGVSGNACVGTPDNKCAWCVTDEPSFGLCFSQEFVDEAKSLIDPNVDPDETWEATFSCTQDDSVAELMGVGALADTKCIEEGTPEDMLADMEEQCGETVDSVKNGCVTASLLGLMDVCVTATQKSVVDYIMDQLNEMGIDDPMSMLDQFGGDGPALGNGDGFGDFGDFDSEEMENLGGFDSENSEMLAEIVDEEEVDDEGDVTDGQ